MRQTGTRRADWPASHNVAHAFGSPPLRRREEIIQGQRRQLGTCLVERLPGVTEAPETLGALLHEIAYAPAMTFVSAPTAGALMRLAMTAILRSKN